MWVNQSVTYVGELDQFHLSLRERENFFQDKNPKNYTLRYIVKWS